MTFYFIKSLQCIARCESAVNQRAFVFAGNNAFERALFGDAEDDDVEFTFAAEGEGGRVHDFEVFVQGFVKGDGFVARGGRVFFRVRGINTVHVGGFEHNVIFSNGARFTEVKSASSIFSVLRSEERRVGKECRSRWSPYH